ncbi:tetratricopeptide repeat protein [Marinobacter sp. F4216]|uniref:tetratricopeptide repeat protein n=1 Tax=Marinobacter sp. F4216 TaxID=2874281 RepID=UPI001CBE249A|nr:tetratricopeptide repeat protein [Marinobacter sp. F4216]MBZ2170414.1 tetratricopeptide repeat protein [Marinobacter sp. F4216]
MLVNRLILGSWLFALASSAVLADDSNTPADAFKQGVRNFQSGDLNEARRAFESARTGGLESAPLLYNLGVVYYRLADYSLAEETFRALLDTKHRPLATYNLGLVALKQGDTTAARAWFEQTLNSRSPDQLQAMADLQLQKLGRSGLSDGYTLTPPNAYLIAAGGYDSNIAGLPDTSVASEGGGFAELLGTGSVGLAEIGSGELRLDGVVYSRRYPSEAEFNTSLIASDVLWIVPHGSGTRGGGVTFSQSWFDTDVFERRYGLEGFQQWSNCDQFLGLSRCGVSLAVAQVAGGEGFEAYEGQWYKLRLTAQRALGVWYWRGEYSFELNNRDDFVAGDEFYSVSPRRHELALSLRYPVSSQLTAGWSGGYRYSRYRDPHRLLETDAPVEEAAVVEQQRVDRWFETGLFAEQRLSDRWLVRAEWAIQDNNSRIARYDYQRHTFMASLEASF